MCTKEEVREVVEETEARIKETITEVKLVLSSLPCNAYAKKLIKLEVKHEALDKSSEKFEAEKNKEIYPRLRECEITIATLTQQNKDQDGWSTKTWGIIAGIFITVFGGLMWFLIRG